METAVTSSKKPRISPLARAAFLIAVMAAGAALIVRERGAVSEALSQVSPAFLGLATLAAFAHVVMSFCGWRVLLNGRAAPDLNASEPAKARMFFVGQLGKYLPGGVWSFLAIAEYGRDAGIPHKQSWSASILALIASFIAGGIIALAVLPQAVMPALSDRPIVPIAITFAALICAALGLKFARPLAARFGGGFALPGTAAILLSIFASGATWILGGLNLMILAQGVGQNASEIGLLSFGAIYAAAWIAGFVFFVAPAGIGAREGVMVALLSASMPLAQAIVIAVLSRILVTIADFALGGAALAIRPAAKDGQATAPRPHQG